MPVFLVTKHDGHLRGKSHEEDSLFDSNGRDIRQISDQRAG